MPNDASQLKATLATDRFIAEAEGQLMVIDMRNVKHFVISPSPEALPQGIIRNAQLVSHE